MVNNGQNRVNVVCERPLSMRRHLPFAKMNNGVYQAVTADVTSSESIMLIFIGVLGHIKQPQIRPHWLALLAHLNKHVPMDLK